MSEEATRRRARQQLRGEQCGGTRGAQRDSGRASAGPAKATTPLEATGTAARRITSPVSGRATSIQTNSTWGVRSVRRSTCRSARPEVDARPISHPATRVAAAITLSRPPHDIRPTLRTVYSFSLTPRAGPGPAFHPRTHHRAPVARGFATHVPRR